MKTKTTEPLPCPCCGEKKLHVGTLQMFGMGVRCMRCGLSILRTYPSRTPSIVKRQPGDLLTNLDAYLLEKATLAWNCRKS